MTNLQPETIFRLKGATRDLIKRVGGLERAGVLAGLSTTQLHRYQNIDEPDLISARTIILLEADCGSAPVSQALLAIAQTNGCPMSGSGGVPELMKLHSEQLSATARLQIATAEAIADGRITPAEARHLDEKAAESEQALTDYRNSLPGMARRAASA